MLELLFVTTLVSVICAMALPPVLASRDRTSGWGGARYLASRIAQARMQATTRGMFVALQFERDERGYRVALYQDGNRNGVRTADIRQGVDRQIDAPVRLVEQFPGVEIAVDADIPASTAVQLGGTNLLSFSPSGTATSGTIHVRGRDGTQWAVRVLGATGRTRVLRYERRSRAWVEPY